MIKQLLKNGVLHIKDLFLNFDANYTLTVDGFYEDDIYAIKINNPIFTHLYCIELATSSNYANTINKDTINNIHKNFKRRKTGFMIRALLKKDKEQKNYIFSFNKELISVVAKYYSVELLKADEILNIIFDLQLDNGYSFDENNRKLKREIDLTENIDYEILNTKYNRLVKDIAYQNLNKLNVYQAVTYKQTTNKNDKSLTDFFQLNFNGVVWQYISFNIHTSLFVVKDEITTSKSGGNTKEVKRLKILEDAISSGEKDFVVINTILMITKDTDKNTIHSSIGDIFNVVFQKEKEGRRTRSKIIKFSPLIERNIFWSKIVTKEFLYDYISTVHKLESPNPHIYGTDINGAVINYNLLWSTINKQNTRPHIFIGGKTGSSKTTFVNCLKAQMIGFDWETGKITKNPNRLVKFREYDIKKSLRPTTEYAKKTNNAAIDIFDTSLNNFSYNLIGIEKTPNGTLNENDISFVKKTTSFILLSKNADENSRLNFEEDSLFGSLIQSVYDSGDYEDITLEELSLYQPKLVEEILEDARFNLDTYLKDLPSDKYNYLQKPTLDAIVKKLEYMKNDSVIKANLHEINSVHSLLKKLTNITKLGEKEVDGMRIPGYFARYEKFSIDATKDWILFDMNDIKDLDEYAPIQWILLNKIATEDKKMQLKLREQGKPEPLIVYFIEEAHNMFKNPLFRSTDDKPGILDKEAKEWRSYNMVLAPISQSVNHLPKEVFDSIQSKFFLFPDQSDFQDGETIDTILDDINSVMSLTDINREMMKNTPRFSACTITEHGTFIIKLENTEKIRKIIDGK